MSFNDFRVSQQLIQGIHSIGFNKPTKFQEIASFFLLSNLRANMIALAHRGSGRTAAFVLAMLNRVDVTRPNPQAVCLSPTYSMALQRGELAKRMGQFLPEIKIGYAVRGEMAVPRGEKVTDHIIFGTPDILLDWIQEYNVLNPGNIKLCVFDQGDVMTALQRCQDQSILIHKTLPKDCQMLFFTETYNDKVKQFAWSVAPNAIDPLLHRAGQWCGNTKHYYVDCKHRGEKLKALSNIYGVLSIGQCIVFCQTRKAALWLFKKMRRRGHSVTLIHDEMAEDQRYSAESEFSFGRGRLLITTVDLDLETPEMTIVVNYDMPVDPIDESVCETYLRRAHNTGWLYKKGIVVNFIHGQPSRETMRKIGQSFGINMTHLDTNDDDTLDKL